MDEEVDIELNSDWDEAIDELLIKMKSYDENDPKILAKKFKSLVQDVDRITNSLRYADVLYCLIVNYYKLAL